MLTTARKEIKIGPDDHGRKMSLRDFEFAESRPGYHYELSRGYITVSEVANFVHAFVVATIREFLDVYKSANPKAMYVALTEMGAKLLIPDWDSERHPDIAVYLTRPKGRRDCKMWRRWFPEFVIEVVSERSRDRDYIEKRQEYWTLGVKEYWIVDADRELVTLLRRGRSDWTEKRIGRDDVCTTKLLPGFSLPCKVIFDAAAEAGAERE